MEYEEDYLRLLRHIVTVTGSLKGQPVGEQDWMIFVEGVSKKLFAHTSSAFVLYQGTELRYDDERILDFIDHSSITVLTRAAIETLLAFHFIFCDAPTIEERRFRFWCWDLAGFLERQGFPIISDEGMQLLEDEAEMLENVKSKVLGHPIFQRMTKKQQENVLDGQWRLGYSWSALAEKAGFDREYFASIYSRLCGYAHTSRLSVLQIQQANAKDIQRNMAEVSLGYCLITMGNFLFGYASLFPIANEAFKADVQAYNTALIWREIGQNIHKGNNGA